MAEVTLQSRNRADLVRRGRYLEYFTILSILWGWRIDKISPDRFDLIGGAVALVGVFIIMYWPRTV